MVRRDVSGLSLSRQCEILSISRSSLYYRLRGESPANLALMRRIDELFLKHPFYGSRQMARHLRREGGVVGRHRVRRLMRLMGLEAIYRAPKTSTPHPEHRVYPYRLKGLAIEPAGAQGDGAGRDVVRPGEPGAGRSARRWCAASQLEPSMRDTVDQPIISLLQAAGREPGQPGADAAHRRVVP